LPHLRRFLTGDAFQALDTLDCLVERLGTEDDLERIGPPVQVQSPKPCSQAALGTV
jgi:hypothetical protein